MPKVAIFYDWLNQWGGAERVLLDILRIYPQATIFTLVHQPNKTDWLPSRINIKTTFLNRFQPSLLPFLSPIFDIAAEQLDLADFDIVISTTSTIGHCLITKPSTLFVCYYHNINRRLYQQNNSLLNLYRPIDKIYSKRPDAIFCNCHNVQQRIKNQFDREAQIIYPGINKDIFTPALHPQGNYYLSVGRLVSHKKTELTIMSCIKLNRQLIIIGTGREENELRKKYSEHKNIAFLGQVSESLLIQYYQNCQALICPQLEDFGLTPIEAQSCGKPVIAFGKGGNLETIIPDKTGVFFQKQTVGSLCLAIKRFEALRIRPRDCIASANRFSNESFMLNFEKAIDKLWQKHQNTSL